MGLLPSLQPVLASLKISPIGPGATPRRGPERAGLPLWPQAPASALAEAGFDTEDRISAPICDRTGCCPFLGLEVRTGAPGDKTTSSPIAGRPLRQPQAPPRALGGSWMDVQGLAAAPPNSNHGIMAHPLRRAGGRPMVPIQPPHHPLRFRRPSPLRNQPKHLDIVVTETCIHPDLVVTETWKHPDFVATGTDDHRENNRSRSRQPP